jgi:isochorismate synthase EntC
MQSDNGKMTDNRPLSAIFDTFLVDGALVQTAPDLYKLFIGPFALVSDFSAAEIEGLDLLYCPDFWDFTKNRQNEVGSRDGVHIGKIYKATMVTELGRQELVELVLHSISEDIEKVIEWRKPDKQAFENQFNWLKDKIKNHEILKGLPITEQVGYVQESENNFQQNKLNILKNILEKKSEQYLYGFWNGASGFIGYTPEVLGQSVNNSFYTMALAGTWNKQSTEKINFEDSKIKNEHQIVVEDILKQLVDEKLISKSSTQVLELEYLYHLKTKFSFQTNNIKNCFLKLHPTAALGLYPRSEKLFLDFQKLDLQNKRKNFGAPFGYIGLNDSFMIVAIRNIYWVQNKVIIYSGCGITSESDLEAEWQELTAKRNAVKQTFGLNL